jgi:dolichol kinase
MDIEFNRKWVQIALSLIVVCMLISLGRSAALLLVGIVLIAGIALQIYQQWKGVFKPVMYILKRFERDGYRRFMPGRGAATMTIGVFFSIFFFETIVAVQAVLVVGISDALSTIFGKRFGTRVLFGSKTVVGSLAFFISTMVIESFFINYLQAIVIAAAIMLVELMPFDDNISVPLATGLLLQLI